MIRGTRLAKPVADSYPSTENQGADNPCSMKIFIKTLPFSLALYLFAGVIAGQEPNDVAAEASTRDVGSYMERILARTQIAVAAAEVVREADKFRREAERETKMGRREKATKLLRQAGEAIAAAIPEKDEKRDDPFLRQYLSQITSEIVAIDRQRQSEFALPNSFPLENQRNIPSVASFINYYSRGRGRRTLEVGYARLKNYYPMMSKIFREEGLPEWLIAGGFIESTYNPVAGSDKQAVGIWQFIPGTGNRYGLRRTAWTDERTHPERSTRAAARYLRDLYALFGDWKLALAGYNWGENRVARLIRRTGIRDFWTLSAKGYFPTETANYVPAILAAAQLFNLPGVRQQNTADYPKPTVSTSMNSSLEK